MSLNNLAQMLRTRILPELQRHPHYVGIASFPLDTLWTVDIAGAIIFFLLLGAFVASVASVAYLALINVYLVLFLVRVIVNQVTFVTIFANESGPGGLLLLAVAAADFALAYRSMKFLLKEETPASHWAIDWSKSVDSL